MARRRIEQANEYAYQHNLIPFTVSSPNFSLAKQIQEEGTVDVEPAGQGHGRFGNENLWMRESG